MDDAEFLRGMEGNKQNEEDFSVGAEHLLRLKKQVGLEPTNYSDLNIEKKAYQIEPSDRTSISKEDFAQPHKQEAGHEGKYPIPDRQHARSALGFAKMHHDASALSAVKKKVEEKYPDMLNGTEKDAGELSAILASAPPALCNGCKKEKHACLCKMASILNKARDKIAGVGAVRDALRSNPTLRAAALGGATSGTVGAAMGAATTPQDRLGGAWKGGWTGAASGAGGGALYHHLNDKLAEMRQKTANALVDAVKSIDPNLLKTTGLGALIGGAGTYLASKPQEDTGKSRAEEELEGKIEAQKNQPERGLLSKMHHRNTELEHGYAKAFREHPIGAAMMGAATGAAGGYGIGRLAGAMSRLRGGRP